MPAAEGQSPLASAERRPHFFKVLIGDFKKRLKIPPKFCKHIPWEASRKAKGLKEASMAATLEGPSGRTWQVVIRRTAEGTFFTAGWAKFVQDQALRELEFLVFRHDGGTSFAAMVFDKSACEREDLLLAGDAPRPRRKRGRPRTASRAVDDSAGMELVPYQLPQVACSDRMPELDKSNDAMAMCSVQHNACNGLAGSAGPPSPMKAERFPTGFSRQHLPREKTEMVLRDPDGKAWAALYIPSTRDRLSRGWCAFARGNCLEEGDCCVFELAGAAEFRVHIFRVVEPAVPAVRLRLA
uniref:B3 domain-containing protein n=1 Tax=Aegilops tauschii TaxID=37682 RepID=M8CP43_AEGTA